MNAWLVANDVKEATFFGQDWGGLIGLRTVAENPDRFDRVVISNTGLPLPQATPDEVVEKVRRFRAEAPTPSLPEVFAALSNPEGRPFAEVFAYWQKWCWESEDLPVGMSVAGTIDGRTPSAEEVAAYDAPFPDPSYKMGTRAMPSQVPTLPDDPSVEANRRAWEVFKKWEKPFLTGLHEQRPRQRWRGAALPTPGPRGSWPAPPDHRGGRPFRSGGSGPKPSRRSSANSSSRGECPGPDGRRAELPPTNGSFEGMADAQPVS